MRKGAEWIFKVYPIKDFSIPTVEVIRTSGALRRLRMVSGRRGTKSLELIWVWKQMQLLCGLGRFIHVFWSTSEGWESKTRGLKGSLQCAHSQDPWVSLDTHLRWAATKKEKPPLVLSSSKLRQCCHPSVESEGLGGTTLWFSVSVQIKFCFHILQEGELM